MQRMYDASSHDKTNVIFGKVVRVYNKIVLTLHIAGNLIVPYAMVLDLSILFSNRIMASDHPV